MNTDHWRRLHPLSPVVRGGRATIALAIAIVPSLLVGRAANEIRFQLGFVAVLTAVAFVSWLVTRWRVDGDDLRIETGLLRRRSLRFPLSQVQAIDVVRPGLARMFGVAELRLRLGGSSGGTARLAYLPDHEVEPLRAQLLSLARGEAAGVEDGAPAVPGHVLTTVPTGRLAVSILISDVGLIAEAVLVGLVVVTVLSPKAATGLVTGDAVWIIGVLTLVWRRFNQEYRLTVADAPEGLRVDSGLVALTHETIRPGRVQAVRMVEPLLWRLLGWCRLEVDIAGRQRSKGEGQAQRGRLRAVLPVGSRALAAGAAPGAVEEPAALPHARVGSHRPVRRDDERKAPAGDVLGTAREGAEPPQGAGTGAAPARPRERPRRHGRPQRPRHTARPGRGRGGPGARGPDRARPLV